MKIEKLQLLQELLSAAKGLCFIADERLRIIWCNQSPGADKLLNKSLYELAGRGLSPPITDEMHIPIDLDGLFYLMHVIPIRTDDIIEGCWGELLTDQIHDDLHRKSVERAFSFSPIFRQSVTGIINSATLLISSLERADMYDEIEIVNLQIQNCYRVLRTLTNWDEVLHYNFGEYEPKLVNLTRMFSDICSICANLIRGEGKNFSYTVTDETICTTLDPDRFMVVLMNLIANSLAYSFEAVSIVATLEKIGHDIVITIQDNGLGLSPETFEKAKESHFVPDVRWPVHEKVGLGLYIADMFVKKVGGNILLSSKKDKGTTLTLRFPINENPEAPIYLESRTSDYITNRFSPIFVMLSDLCDLKMY